VSQHFEVGRVTLKASLERDGLAKSR